MDLKSLTAKESGGAGPCGTTLCPIAALEIMKILVIIKFDLKFDRLRD